MKAGHDEEDGFPPRLAEGQGQASELLRRFVRQAQPAPPESAAWERTVVRLVRSSRSPRAALGLAVLGGAAAMGLAVSAGVWLASSRPEAAHRESVGSASVAVMADVERPGGRPSVAAASVAPGGAPPEGAARAVKEPVLSLAHGPVRLPAGPSRLEQRARVILSTGGRAVAASSRRNVTLVLEAGELDLDERAARPGQGPMVVVAAPYRLVVLGAAFRVTRDRDDVVVQVDAGRVAIERDGIEVVAVGAGRSWSGGTGPLRARAAPSPEALVGPASPSPTTVVAERASAAPAEAAALPVASGETTRSCATDGNTEEALRCLGEVARGRSLSAEVALYQSAQIHRQSLRDPQGALADLQELRRRFPGGALRAEVSLALAEVLPELGRYEEALAESAKALSLAATSRRAADVRVLRARILAVGLRDCAGARRELAAAGSSADAFDELSRCEEQRKKAP